MKKSFFNNQTNAERLSKKLINWYGAKSIVKHSENHSEIHVNNMVFVVSDSIQIDKGNGCFRLTHNSKPIEFTTMYDLVNSSKR
jgi:hypothetical protein